MIAIAVLGLLLPGYLLARAIGSSYCWTIAFPLSVVLLAETVVIYTCVGIPLRFGYVLAALVVVSVICWIAALRRQPEPIAPEAILPSTQAPKVLVVTVAVLVGLVLLGMAVRTSLYPLSGYDTPIRWNLLARLMMEHQGLSFYPPLTAADFTIYPSFPDSFPPLVSTVYWWLYAAWGNPLAALTSVPVTLQAICTFALVYYAASLLFGRAGGLVALAVLASTSLFLRGIAIGQETGYTALSYAGQLAFAIAATRQPRAGTVAIAGMFAALGALARDYGPLLPLVGFSVLVCHRSTRRYLPLFCLVAALAGGIWFVRNWVLTGNPVYPLGAGLGLPTNPIHTAVLEKYSEVLGLQQYSWVEWVSLVIALVLGAPLVVFVGVPCVFVAGRSGVAIGIAAALAVFIWAWSVPFTAGGVIYSLRVLAPAFVALSIAAGAFGRLLTGPVHRWNAVLLGGATLVLIICGGFAAACCWSQPLPPDKLPQAAITVRSDLLETLPVELKLARRLEDSDLPACGILMDRIYMAVVLQRETRFRPVMVWSPEVWFLFDRTIPLAELRQRLRARNILLIAEWNQSYTNYYLNQFPLFSEPQQALQVFTQVPDVATILILKPEEDGQPGIDTNPRP